MVTHFNVAQLPDEAHSQDRAFFAPSAAVVLDGASPFLPVDVETGLYVDTLGGEIVDRLSTKPYHDLPDVVAEAIRATTNTLGLASADASPSSTIAVVRDRGETVDLYVLGDNAIFYGHGQESAVLADGRLAALGIPEHRLYRERLASGGGYDAEHRDLLDRLQRQQRARRNRPGGYWIAETDPAAAHRAVARSVRRHEIRWAVVATDGAYKPMRHLGLDDWRAVAHQDRRGLLALLKQCADWETTADPDGRELPRAKVTDDKALVAITFD